MEKINPDPSGRLQVYLQQDNFLDKDTVSLFWLLQSEKPVNQKWGWDRILRSFFITQADLFLFRLTSGTKSLKAMSLPEKPASLWKERGLLKSLVEGSTILVKQNSLISV